jgi:hypothetical protein
MIQAITLRAPATQSQVGKGAFKWLKIITFLVLLAILSLKMVIPENLKLLKPKNNQFRMVQTREKLKRDKIKNQRDAMETHETVGKEVRKAIEKIGGTLPENLPPAEPIKMIKKRIKTNQPRLVLDSKETLAITNNSDFDT